MDDGVHRCGQWLLEVGCLGEGHHGHAGGKRYCHGVDAGSHCVGIPCAHGQFVGAYHAYRFVSFGNFALGGCTTGVDLAIHHIHPCIGEFDRAVFAPFADCHVGSGEAVVALIRIHCYRRAAVYNVVEGCRCCGCAVGHGHIGDFDCAFGFKGELVGLIGGFEGEYAVGEC